MKTQTAIVEILENIASQLETGVDPLQVSQQVRSVVVKLKKTDILTETLKATRPE